MSIFKRFLALALMIVAFSTLLVACGGDNTPIPSYTGATSVTDPAATKSFQDAFKNSNKDAKITSYTTKDGADKVKSFFTDNFKNNGWNDKSGDKDIADSSKQFSDIIPGASLQAFEKGSHKAIIITFPGSSAAALGYQGVDANGTAYMVVDATV